MRYALTKILATITGKPRYFPDIQWSSVSWTYNVFRIFEYLFGRRYGIRAEMSANSEGIVQFHTWEAAIVHTEAYLRSHLPKPRLVKVYIPQFAPAGLALPSSSPYLFAIAFDATALGSEVNNGGQSWNHTCTGSDGILFAYDTAESSTTDPYTGMTYNSGAMTVVASKASSTRFGKMWYKLSPTTGSSLTIAPTLSSSQYNQGASASYSGVNQSGLDNSNTGSGTNSSITLTITPVASSNNCWAIGGITNDVGTTFTPNIGIQRQKGSAPLWLGDSNGTVSSSGYTQTVTVNGSGNYSWVMASFAPIAAAVVIMPRKALLGVGN